METKMSRRTFVDSLLDFKRTSKRVDERVAELLPSIAEKPEPKSDSEIRKELAGFEADDLIGIKVNMDEIIDAILTRNQVKPIENLLFVATVESMGEVIEHSVSIWYGVKLIADGEEIHRVTCMKQRDSCLVSEFASGKRMNSFGRCKLFADYLHLLVDSYAYRGTYRENEKWLPKSYGVTEEINIGRPLLYPEEFPYEAFQRNN